MAGSTTRMRKLIRWIEQQPGWRVKRGGGHCMVLAPDGVGMVTIGLTPHNNKRAWPNMISQLNKIGLTDIPTF